MCSCALVKVAVLFDVFVVGLEQHLMLPRWAPPGISRVSLWHVSVLVSPPLPSQGNLEKQKSEPPSFTTVELLMLG